MHFVKITRILASLPTDGEEFAEGVPYLMCEGSAGAVSRWARASANSLSKSMGSDSLNNRYRQARPLLFGSLRRIKHRRLWRTHINIFRGLTMAFLLVQSIPEWNLWSLLPPWASNRQSKEKIHRNSRSHLGWHFRMLFQSSKLKARTSLLPRFSETRRSSFELSVLSFERAFKNVTTGVMVCTILLYLKA